MKTLVALLALLLLPVQEPSTLSLRKTDGDLVTAQVLGVDGDRVKLKVMVMGGSMTVTHMLSDFDSSSTFAVLMAANPPKTYADHFAMAKKAAELGLLDQAASEGRAARKSVEGTPEQAEKIKELHLWAADALERYIGKACEAGDLDTARHGLGILSSRLNDVRTEAQIDAVADKVDELAAKQAAEREAKRQAATQQKLQADISLKLQAIQKLVAAGDASLGDAIRKSGSTVASVKLCESAIASYKSAYKSLQELVEKNSEDVALSHAAASITTTLRNQATRAALQAANMLTIQSDYKGALEWCTKILAMDPDNAEAKDMVKTIQVAEASASSDWDWRWNRVGRRPDDVGSGRRR